MFFFKSDNAKNQRTNLTPCILGLPAYVVGQACLAARQGRVGVGKNRAVVYTHPPTPSLKKEGVAHES